VSMPGARPHSAALLTSCSWCCLTVSKGGEERGS